MFSGLPPKRPYSASWTLASLQPRSRVALGHSCSCDRALAMQLGDALLSGPTLLNGALKLTQASSELATLAPHLGKLGCERIAFARQRGELLPGERPARSSIEA